MTVPAHLPWLVRAAQPLRSKDGKEIEMWQFQHQPDAKILSDWARHFRSQYCDDKQIDLLRDGTGHSRSEYLRQIKFPDPGAAPGPSVRSGDFAEILVADYIEFVLRYWVPRLRYSDKTVRNESKKGSDVIGFQFQREDQPSPGDTMIIFESKAQLSGQQAREALQDAINHSAKDEIRKAESLNAMKQRLLDQGNMAEASKIARFQNPADKPYRDLYGAAALISTELVDPELLAKSDVGAHPHKEKLALIVITGDNLMDLVHQLYDRAANEA